MHCGAEYLKYVNFPYAIFRTELTNLGCKAVIIPDTNGPEALPPKHIDALGLMEVPVLSLIASQEFCGLFHLTLTPFCSSALKKNKVNTVTQRGLKVVRTANIF